MCGWKSGLLFAWIPETARLPAVFLGQMSIPLPQNPEAFLQHLDFVRGLAKGLLFDDHEAEEVVQQAWVAASRRPEASEHRAWLARLATNLAHNLRRTTVRRQRRERAAARPERVPSAAQVAEREETRRRIVEAALALEEPYRSTVLLRYFEDLMPSAIARELGLPSATVRTRLRRGLEKLRERLDREHGGDRRGWATALLPLAGDLRSAGVSIGAATALGWIATFLAAAGVIAGGFLFFQRSQAPTAEEGPDLLASASRGEGVLREAPGGDPLTPRIAVDVPPMVDRDGLVSFAGRLLDSHGQKLPGARVVCVCVDLEGTWLRGTDPLESATRSLAVRTVEGRADATGRFELTGLPPQGLYALHLGPDSAHPTVRLVEQSPAPGERVELGELRLLPSARIDGRVMTRSGDPVAGALVVGLDLPSASLGLVPLPGLRQATLLVWPERGLVLGLHRLLGGLLEALPLPVTTTRDDGGFELRGLPPGQTSIVVQSATQPTLVRGGLRLRAREKKEVGTLRLPRGHRVAGVVRDADGKPVPDAEVWVAPIGLTGGPGFARRSTRSDPQGRFAVDGLPRARCRLVVRRGPGESWTIGSPRRRSESMEVVLPARFELGLRVVSGGGRPLEGLRFKLLQGEARGELALGGFAEGIRLDGRLEDRGEGSWTLRALEAGRYTLLVQADHHVIGHAVFTLPRKEPLRVELAPSTAFTIVVRDAEGRPVAGAAVHAQSSPAAWQASMLPRYSIIPRWRRYPIFAGRTATDGRLSVTAAAAGEVLLTIAHPRLGRHVRRTKLPRTQLEIQLPRPGALAGVLSEGGEMPPPGKWLIVVERRRKDTNYLEMPRTSTLDARGRFRATGLVPGEYRIEAQCGFGGVRSPGTLYGWFDRDPLELLSFADVGCTVASGAVAEVELDASPRVAKVGEGAARVAGRVLLDGRPARGLVPRFGSFFDMRAADPVDAAGRFDLGLLKPGRLELELEEGRTTPWRRVYDLQAGQDLDVVVELWTGGVTGVVFGPDGAPARTRVFASARDPKTGARLGASSLVETDAQGRFRLERLPEGPWLVAVQDVEIGRGAQPVQVERGEVTSNVLIQLSRVFTIAGRVVTKGLAGPNAKLGNGTLVVETEHGEVFAAGALGESDAVFRVRGLLPGRYRLRVQFTVESGGPTTQLLTREAGFVEVVDRDRSGLVVKPDRR